MHFLDDDPKATYPKRAGGVLTPEHARALRQAGVALAFDPVQIGWVREDAPDDMSDLERWNGLANPAEIKLRPWSPHDAAVLAAILSDPDLWRFMPDAFPGILSPAQARNLIEVANHAQHHLVRAVVKNGLLVGQVRLEIDKGGPGISELSYWIGKDHRGGIIAPRAINLLLNETRQMHIVTVFAVVHQDNRPSLRVVKKLGFAPVSQDGVWIRLHKDLQAG